MRLSEATRERERVTAGIEVRNGERRGGIGVGIGAEEEGDAGLVEEESSGPELELDLSPRFGVVDSHEGFPRGR